MRSHSHRAYRMAAPNTFRKYLRFSTVGLELGLSVMIGLIGGTYLDRWLGTEPWLLLVGLLFGMTAGFRSLFRLLKNFQNDLKDDERNNAP